MLADGDLLKDIDAKRILLLLSYKKRATSGLRTPGPEPQ